MSPTSSPVPRLSSVPSAVLAVRTIASRSPGRTTNKGEERGDTLPGSGWMPSPPPLHRSTSNQKGSHSFCLSSCPPRPLPRPLPLHQVVRVGKRASQGGRSPPAHPAGVCLGIRLLSSSYHLTIKAIPGRWSVFFKRGEALKYFFSAYQIINRKTRSWYQI